MRHKTIHASTAVKIGLQKTVKTSEEGKFEQGEISAWVGTQRKGHNPL
jgi:hypothetical protein